jgi:sulfonate transport system permease protein
MKGARRAVGVLFLLALLGAWEAAGQAGLLPQAYFSRPTLVAERLWASAAAGQLHQPMLMTVRKMLLGWVLASLAGIALALALWRSPAARAYGSLTLEFLRPLPASALIPPAILLLGLTENMVVSVIVFGTIWPVLLGTLRGLDSIDQRLQDVSTVLHLTRTQQLRHVWLPCALPDALTGIRVAMAGALILSVVGEMLASQPGLGTMVLQAARSFRSDELYAGVALLALLGIVFGSAVTRLESHLLRWREAQR